MAKKITHINTVDGDTTVEWWEEADFYGRSIRVGDLDTGKIVSVIPVPDNCIVCDFCNVKISEFPVPVLDGIYAVCKACYESIQKEVTNETEVDS